MKIVLISGLNETRSVVIQHLTPILSEYASVSVVPFYTPPEKIPAGIPVIGYSLGGRVAALAPAPAARLYIAPCLEQTSLCRAIRDPVPAAFFAAEQDEYIPLDQIEFIVRTRRGFVLPTSFRVYPTSHDFEGQLNTLSEDILTILDLS
jgi:dienelactone hydrolase